MSLFIKKDIQSTIVTCSGETLELAEEAANELLVSEQLLSKYAEIDDFGIEVKPGRCFHNVLVRGNTYI